MTGIIDYNAGNIPSVARALDAIGCPYKISKSPKELQDAERLIFPGVGDAQYAMSQLESTGFRSFLQDSFAQGTPILGICLGSQIIFDFSEEGDVPCLGLLSGRIRHFTQIQKDFPLKVPHMGWNNLELSESENQNPCGLFDGIPKDASFYFVHSYVIQPNETQVVRASADYGIKVPAVICSGNLYAVQFHPEKSGEPGLQLLRNFAKKNRDCNCERLVGGGGGVKC